jgi:hypothetical protein
MFSSFLRSFRSVAAIFRPPFDGLWLVCTLYFFWAFLVYPHSPVLHFDLPDTDDYTYLNQVLDWLKGQGWYDNVQHRLNPPYGVPIHFSRLTMLPMVGIIKIIQFLGLGPKGSALLMATIYPPMLLAVFFLTLRFTAASFMPREWAGITSFVGLFATSALFMFQPGRVDHHGLNLILIATVIGCVTRMVLQPDVRKWPLLAGGAMALSLVVALEILPWLLLISAFIGLWAAFKTGNAVRSGLLYSLTLFLGSFLGLLVARPPEGLFQLDVLAYSVVYVILTGGVAIAFCGQFLATRAPLAVRLLVGVVMAAGAGFLFLRHFPELMTGPYGGIDPALAHIILDEISEAQPMKEVWTSWLTLFWPMATCCVSFPVALWFLRKARGADAWVWSLQVLMMLGAAGLALFYQRRFIVMLSMLHIIPLAVLLQHGWGWIAAHWRGRLRFFAEIGIILLAGPLPAVLVPALVDGRSFNTGVLLFPVGISPQAVACETYTLENVLRNPMGLGKKPLTIMNPLGEGPELLFRTQHRVLAAPYHMDVEGNVDSTRFFSTPYPDEAETIVRRRGIDLVLTCRYAERFYFETKAWGKDQTGAEPGKDFAPHFIERLLTGHIPPWLKPVKVPGLDNYVIYEVLPPAKDSKH